MSCLEVPTLKEIPAEGKKTDIVKYLFFTIKK